MKLKMALVALLFTIFAMQKDAGAQPSAADSLDAKQESLIVIASYTAKGDLLKLKSALNGGLDAGLTVNQIREAIIHTYAYCGFPRSIRGLQTFMTVLEARKAKGVNDSSGSEDSPVKANGNKYARGKKVLEKLTRTPQPDSLTGYSAFAPIIDTFLKTHLFADIFERDVLTYSERELITISVLSTIGGLEPMLRSHLNICLNTGLSPMQLQQFISVMRSTGSKNAAKAAEIVLNQVLKEHQS